MQKLIEAKTGIERDLPRLKTNMLNEQEVWVYGVSRVCRKVVQVASMLWEEGRLFKARGRVWKSTGKAQVTRFAVKWFKLHGTGVGGASLHRRKVPQLRGFHEIHWAATTSPPAAGPSPHESPAQPRLIVPTVRHGGRSYEIPPPEQIVTASTGATPKSRHIALQE